MKQYPKMIEFGIGNTLLILSDEYYKCRGLNNTIERGLINIKYKLV